MKKLRVTVEGKVYEVLVEILDEQGTTAPMPIASPALQSSNSVPLAAPIAAQTPAKTGSAAQPGDVRSPLAGKLVSIDVKLGQSVEEGAQVATVEAMKMNTYIHAPRSGKVEAIYANAGDGVEEGAPILCIK